jgi:hypothetical protein
MQRGVLLGDLELGRALLRDWGLWLRRAREMILVDGVDRALMLPNGCPEPAIAAMMELRYGFAGEEGFFDDWAADAVRHALALLRLDFEDL